MSSICCVLRGFLRHNRSGHKYVTCCGLVSSPPSYFILVDDACLEDMMHMPSSRTICQSNADDALANVILSLELLQTAFTTLANVPLLGAIVSCVLGIAKPVEVLMLLPFQRQ